MDRLTKLKNQSRQHPLNGLDHLRALAICSVFLFHYQILSGGKPGWVPVISQFGWTGVDLFFVLSGFLISSQLFSQIREGKQLSLKVFFLKRFFRIIPAFWAITAIYFCIPFFREKESLPAIWRFLTFTQNFGLNLGEKGTFSHAWSLCVEEHFYLLLPITLVIILSTGFFRKAYWLLAILFIFGIASRIYCFEHFYLPATESANSGICWYQYIYYPTYNRLDGLLAGVSIAGIYRFFPERWDRLAKYGNLIILSSLIVLAGAYYICEDQLSYNASVWGFPLVAAGYGLMVMGAVSSSSFLYKWNPGITKSIASLSYSIYLTHKGIIHMTHTLLADFRINDGWMLGMCMITCISGAWLLNLVIEKPFMKLRDRIIRDKQLSCVGTE